LEIDPGQIVAHAKRFGRDRFFRNMHLHIDNLLAQRNILSSSNFRVEPDDIVSSAP
jgi:hypothetical protein